jgi:asparagine synthase (glutamine-hydrolysing)
MRVECYWRLQDHLRPPGGRPVRQQEEAKLIEDFRQRLREAAISRLVSDVPLGVFLSGGVDSSTLVALMSQLAPGQVNTFAVAFGEKSFNEEPYAAIVARHFHTQHHVLTAEEPVLRKGLERVATHLDEPLADPAVVPTFLLSQFARAHIKVALSGEGSDEIFGGYPTYLGAVLAPYYLRLPRFIRHQIIDRIAALLPVSPGAVPIGLFLRRFLSHVEKSAAQRHQIWFGMLSPEEVNQIWQPASSADLQAGTGSAAQSGTPFLRSPLWGRGEGGEGVNRMEFSQQDASASLFTPLQAATAGVKFENELAEALYIDFSLYLPDDLLVKLDRASMACSLELRTPFLDHRLIEAAAGLPAGLRVRGLQLKYLLKKAVEPWLPRQIVYRQKRGFSVPIAAWMRKELQPLLREMLSETRLKTQALFNAAFIRRIMEEHRQGRADHRKMLWTLLMFELWYEHWARP